jgi:hypothetical protein
MGQGGWQPREEKRRAHPPKNRPVRKRRALKTAKRAAGLLPRVEPRSPANTGSERPDENNSGNRTLK